MSDLLWKKSGQSGPDEKVMAFLAGDDVKLDRYLLGFDIQASAAHANGLRTIGVLSDEECNQVQGALRAIADDLASGKKELDIRFEDGHSAIEAWLTESLGPLGAKIHTGRSRNDQVAVALRLYLKHQLEMLLRACEAIARALLARAAKEKDIVLPGHTHLQKAMPSSAGLWLAGHAEAFIDNTETAFRIRQCIDASPLGTASGFGINLPLAREQVAQELSFARLVVNPQYAQNARGKVEWLALTALAAATLDLRRFAWDLSLFSSDEFDYLVLAQRYCTGSSIMPNKNNPDVAELLRATHGVVVGAQAELNEVLALPSGYHRDLQATKPPVIRAFTKGLQALDLVPDLVRTFEWKRDKLAKGISPEMFATDETTELAAQGMPFREAYRNIAENLSAVQNRDALETVRKRISPGASGKLMLEVLTARLDELTGIEK
ncbi:MAG: argininosuccinate lyase [Xanthomonadales bacterium]|nr:argininosuccinate lyase [Gammaproteobacteria bacterium]NNE04241.1 argininosuccinate lyase [Xanthomonadales bacterium]NNL94842.1 argininosuccinate lyase [Xanthomonadales bacterium]